MNQETRDKLENLINSNLDILLTENMSDGERSKTVEDTVKLAKSLDEIDKNNFDLYERSEKLKNERKKAKRDKKQFVESENNKVKIELIKGGCLIGSAVLGYIAYDMFQKRVIRFEETGKLVSNAWRELHLPKIKI